MKTYFADLIITNDGVPLRGGRITVEDDGTILEVQQGEISSSDIHIPGILVPGFVNAHTHLELAYLKSSFDDDAGGMSAFISNMMRVKRKPADDQLRLDAMLDADRMMFKNGIVAAGDISNESISFSVKSESAIYYHTFIELMGLDKSGASGIVEKGVHLKHLFSVGSKMKASLAPHAMYSCSDELLDLILASASESGLVSIHMHESDEELLFCKELSGPFVGIFQSAGISLSDFVPLREKSPMMHFLKMTGKETRIQLVHNTMTGEEEIAQVINSSDDIYWCLCPSANLFITGRLPDLAALYKHKAKVTIGTDSLASNHGLSPLAELSVIQSHCPQIPFTELIKWATINGAEFLGIENSIGKIKAGFKPGLIGLKNVHPEKPVIDKFSEAIRII